MDIKALRERVWSDSTIWVLKRIYYHILECFVERAGQDFNGVFFPYADNAGRAGSQFCRIALGLEGNDLVSNSRIASFGNEYFSYSSTTPAVYENAIVKNIDNCIVQDGPPEACWHCYLGGVQLSHAVNPDHEITFTKLMPQGARTCEYHIAERSKHVRNERDYGKYLYSLPENPLGADDRLKLTRRVLAEEMFAVISAYSDNYGSEDLVNRMRHRMHEEGMRFVLGTNGPESSSIGREGLDRGFRCFGSAMFWDMEKDDSGLGDRLTITNCPFSSESPYICHMIEDFCTGLCLASDPTFEIVQLAKMTEGANACAYLIRQIDPPHRNWRTCKPAILSNCLNEE